MRANSLSVCLLFLHVETAGQDWMKCEIEIANFYHHHCTGETGGNKLLI